MKSIYVIPTAVILAISSNAWAQQVNQAPPAQQPPTQQQVTTQTVTTPSPQPQSSPMTMSLPENADPWQLSVQGGGLWPQEDKDRLHKAEDIIGRLTYDFTPNLAIGAESGGLRFEDESNGTRFGHLDAVPAMADLMLKLPVPSTGNRLVPYVYGAAGAMFWSYSKSGYSDQTGTSARSRTHFAAKPGAGVEYYLTPHVALFVEASYLFSQRFELKNSTGIPNPNGKLRVNSIYGGGGIKIAF